MTDVFVSFCTQDDAVATAVCDRIEAEGFKCWRCTRPEDNIAGTDWLGTLVDRLQEAEVVVLLHSSHAELSHYTFKEVRMAASLQKPVIVLQLEDIPLAPAWAFLLRTMQTVSVTKLAREKWMEQMLSGVTHLTREEASLPLDSIHDRRLKIDLCCHLARELGCGTPRVLIGAGLRMPGIAAAFLHGPARLRAQVNAIESTVARVAGAEAGEEPWFCIPFWIAEDVIALLGMAATEAQQARLRRIFSSLPALLADALARVAGTLPGGDALRPEVRMASAIDWPFSRGEEWQRVLEHYFTRLGSADVASPAEQAPFSNEPEETPGARAKLARLAGRILGELARGQGAQPVPHAMTALRAESHLARMMRMS